MQQLETAKQGTPLTQFSRLSLQFLVQHWEDKDLEEIIQIEILNLVVMVLNDGSYGMIRWKQAGAGMPDWGLEFGNPDFVKYAQSYGAHGHRVSSAENLIPTLEAAFKAGGVHLVDVPVDYSQNRRLLIDELKKNHRTN